MINKAEKEKGESSPEFERLQELMDGEAHVLGTWERGLVSITSNGREFNVNIYEGKNTNNKIAKIFISEDNIENEGDVSIWDILATFEKENP